MAVATDALCLAVSVDDARPEQGFGGDRDRGPLGYLLRLHEEVGCKSTLFVPTDWESRVPLTDHLDWLGWLQEQPCFEIACHGHLHAIKPGSGDPGEFRGIDAETAEARIQQSLEAFAEAGYRPLGFKAPGWFLEASAYRVLDGHFSYVADHVTGTEVSRLQGGRLLRLPYLYTIDRIGAWPEAGLVVLQSHAAPDGAITNGWCEWLYERVRAFVRTGVRLGARFVTLGEFAQEMAEPRATDKTPAAGSTVRSHDRRLYGGRVRLRGEQAGVLYNETGAPCDLSLAPENAAIALLSRNRRDYLADLLASVDATGPKELERFVLLNNCEDDSAELVRAQFPRWQVVEFNDADHPEEPAGLSWLKEHMPGLLPAQGWTAPRSIGWLTNQVFLCTGRDFVLKFDDDFVVKPGWWDYYVRFQQGCGAHAVINNFGAFVMARSVPARIAWIDERFLGSHGFEDNDYALRLAEGNVRWVLGFNRDHDWRSAEEGNPRGSMTGCDLFVHRYAFALEPLTQWSSTAAGCEAGRPRRRRERSSAWHGATPPGLSRLPPCPPTSRTASSRGPLC